jgi:hypothetical protein
MRFAHPQDPLDQVGHARLELAELITRGVRATDQGMREHLAAHHAYRGVNRITRLFSRSRPLIVVASWRRDMGRVLPRPRRQSARSAT